MVSIASLPTTAHRHSTHEKPRPSLLSTSHRPTSTAEPMRAQLGQVSRNVMYSYAWMMHNQGKYVGKVPLVVHTLRYCKLKHSKGWLRRIGRSSTNVKPGSQLSKEERNQAFQLLLAAEKSRDAVEIVAYAFGRTPQAIRNLYRAAINKGGDTSRQQRSDAGTSIIENSKMQTDKWTAKSIFAKRIRKKSNSKLTQADIDVLWKTVDPALAAACAETAKEWRGKGPYLRDELIKALEKTVGAVSWQTLVTLVAGNGPERISASTIRRYLMSMPNSTYKAPRMLPKLDQANKLKRFYWSIEFWVFWESAVRFQSTQLVLVHMDQMWFGVIHLQTEPVFCIAPVDHAPVDRAAHSKIVMEKTVANASTAFIPFNNDFTKGGSALLVSLTRVGGIPSTSQETYSRNLVFSLLPWFINTEIPTLDKLAQQIGGKTGKKVAIRYQMDSSWPQTDGRLVEFLETEFMARNWILNYQHSDLALTNVQQDCVFPMLSKLVEQDLHSCSERFQNQDALWETLSKCWKELPLDILERAYVRNSQISSAIYHSKGGDDFVHEKNGLHCQVRKACVPVYSDDGKHVGVEILTTYDPDAVEPPKLRYCKPVFSEDIVEEAIGRLSQHEIYLMFDCLPYGDPWFHLVEEIITDIELKTDNRQSAEDVGQHYDTCFEYVVDTANERMQQSCQAGRVNDLVHQTMGNYGGLEHGKDYQQLQSEEAHILPCEAKKPADPFYFHYRHRKLSCDKKVSSECPVRFFRTGLGTKSDRDTIFKSSVSPIKLEDDRSMYAELCNKPNLRRSRRNQLTEMDSYTNNKGGIISSHKFMLKQFVDQDELQRLMEDNCLTIKSVGGLTQSGVIPLKDGVSCIPLTKCFSFQSIEFLRDLRDESRKRFEAWAVGNKENKWWKESQLDTEPSQVFGAAELHIGELTRELECFPYHADKKTVGGVVCIFCITGTSWNFFSVKTEKKDNSGSGCYFDHAAGDWEEFEAWRKRDLEEAQQNAVTNFMKDAERATREKKGRTIDAYRIVVYKLTPGRSVIFAASEVPHGVIVPGGQQRSVILLHKLEHARFENTGSEEGPKLKNQLQQHWTVPSA